MAYELPKVPYAYDALEPHIDAKTMEIHHTKHHQAYTDGLNNALATLSSEIQSMELSGGGKPGGSIADAINSVFGNFDSFKEKFTKDTIAIQGSGWGWLTYNP